MALVDMHPLSRSVFLRRIAAADLVGSLRELAASRGRIAEPVGTSTAPSRRLRAEQLPPVQSCQASIFRELRKREAAHSPRDHRQDHTDERFADRMPWLAAPITLFHRSIGRSDF